MKIREVIGCAFIILSGIILFGAVGSFEHDTITFAGCIIRAAVAFAVNGIGIAVFGE